MIVFLLRHTARTARDLTGSAVLAGQDLSLSLLPHGGQGRSRRNAWQAMSSDVVTSRARRAADAAVRRAAASGHPAGSARLASLGD